MSPSERRLRHAFAALVGAAAGAWWHAQIQPAVVVPYPVEIPAVEQTVTPATAAPPTVASVQP